VSLVGGRTVGSVLRVARAGTEEYYVVLRDGLQRIGGLTADLIRFGDPRGATEITTVAADLVAASPLVDTLPSASFPIGRPRSVHSTVTCAQPGRPDASRSAPDPSLRVRRRCGWRARTGQAPRSIRSGCPRDDAPMSRSPISPVATGSAVRYLITDAGVRFALHDSTTAVALGLAGTLVVAPWP
jgi:hypothetical protein